MELVSFREAIKTPENEEEAASFRTAVRALGELVHFKTANTTEQV